MADGEGAAFAVVSVIFLVFEFGLVVTYQGIVGRDLDLSAIRVSAQSD